jgi:uncharacterized protein (TIGR02145 family)
MSRKIRIVPFILLLVACNRQDREVLRPAASYRIDPEAGQTTDTFSFDASATMAGGRRVRAYYRWDWDHDGRWDNEYSQLPLTPHRFYREGTFRPLLGVINSEGLEDTVSLTLTVKQGYSPPRPSFTIDPPVSNLKTTFTLDASTTRDDEDSIGQLKFMWDFDGNGSWDTPLSSKTSITHVYPDTGHFQPRLQVADPRNLRATVARTVWVTNINNRLVADFNWNPEYGTTDSVFTLDASKSHHLDYPDALLRYSWKLPPNYEWSDWSYDPVKTIRFVREATYTLELRIMDTASLINSCSKKITVYHQNVPPSAKFTIGCRRGNIRTQFYFDSWPTLDQESLPTSLQVRWDFNGDGQWDTDYSDERTIFHSYPQPGTYKVYLEARDPDGLSDTTAQFVEVSPWTNETGLIHDQRDGQYYGTVKIGSQWWMSQNLNFAPFDPHKDEVQKICYFRYPMDPVKWCNILGGLYNCYHATREDWYGEVQGICPNGWHMPSRKEWETLIGYIGGYDQADKLLPGGETDFNALYAGYIGEVSTPKGPELKCYWLNYGTYFWSFTKMSGLYAPNSWNITLIKDEQRILPGFSDMKYYYSVRCIKDD